MNKKFIPLLLPVCCLGLVITYIINYKSIPTTNDNTDTISSEKYNNYKDTNPLTSKSTTDKAFSSGNSDPSYTETEARNNGKIDSRPKENANNSPKINDNVKTNISNENPTQKKSISINKYIKDLDCIKYTVKKGDTLTNISKAYESTCNLNTSVQLLKLVNNLSNTDNLEIGDTIYIPKKTLTTGTLFYINNGETWYNIISNNYPDYTVESVVDFLIKINALPNSDCPAGEKIFLPKLSENI